MEHKEVHTAGAMWRLCWLCAYGKSAVLNTFSAGGCAFLPSIAHWRWHNEIAPVRKGKEIE